MIPFGVVPGLKQGKQFNEISSWNTFKCRNDGHVVFIYRFKTLNLQFDKEYFIKVIQKSK